MTDFILKLCRDRSFESRDSQFGTIIENYANFFKKPLELWMFVPCDEKGNVMKEPYMVFTDDNEECDDYIKLFYEAKERCLFEINSFEEDSENYWYFGLDEFSLIGVEKTEIIESLATYSLTLTKTALKQIGL